MAKESSTSEVAPSKKEEQRAFLFLTVFLAPIVTVFLIASFGFVIWVLQMIFGPPSQ